MTSASDVERAGGPVRTGSTAGSAALVFGALAGLIGVAIVAGWLFSVPVMRRVSGTWPLGALGFILLGAALALAAGARRHAVSALEKLQLMRDLLDHSSDLVYVADARTREVLDCNATLPRRLGYTPEEILRMKVQDLSGEAIPDEEWLGHLEALGTTSSLLLEKHYRCKDGTRIPVEVNVRCVEHEGDLVLFAVIRDLTESHRTEAALRDYAERLKAASRQTLEVQEEERRRLSRELHDTVGQELTALALNLAVVRTAIPAELLPAVGQRLEDSQGLIAETSQHVREVMAELRPPGLDELGLLAALKEHARRVAVRSRLQVTVEGAEPHPRLPPSVAIELFRIAQEAVNNAVKHAQATRIRMEVVQNETAVRLSIVDNGRGFPVAPRPRGGLSGMGMITMRERAETIGAELTTGSGNGTGARVLVDLPWAHPAAVPHPD